MLRVFVWNCEKWKTMKSNFCCHWCVTERYDSCYVDIQHKFADIIFLSGCQMLDFWTSCFDHPCGEISWHFIVSSGSGLATSRPDGLEVLVWLKSGTGQHSMTKKFVCGKQKFFLQVLKSINVQFKWFFNQNFIDWPPISG